MIARLAWLINYDEVRLAYQNRGHHWPTFQPSGDMWVESRGDDDDAGWG
jgi:hypothetical protein